MDENTNEKVMTSRKGYEHGSYIKHWYKYHTHYSLNKCTRTEVHTNVLCKLHITDRYWNVNI